MSNLSIAAKAHRDAEAEKYYQAWICGDMPSFKDGFDSGYEFARKETIQDYETRCRRTIDAAFHALLEMSAWLGIPEKKRMDHIEYLMGNVKFCSENDLRHMDQPQPEGE